MEKFNVLPTDDKFKQLDDFQIEFILTSMERDAWEIKQRQKGQQHYENLVEDEDTNFLNVPEEEFEVVPKFLDAEELYEQALNRLSESAKAKHEERLKAEFEDGGQNEPDLHHESIMEHIRRNIDELDDELQNGKFKEEKVINKENIADALAEFEDEDDYI